MLCVDFPYLKPDSAVVGILNILLHASLMPTGPPFAMMKGSVSMLLTFNITYLNIIGRRKKVLQEDHVYLDCETDPSKDRDCQKS